MPLALILIGLMLVVSGARNTHGDLGALVQKDFSGKGSFFYWVGGIGAVGSVGYIPAMQSVSRIFLGLILLVVFLANGGLFNKLQAALQTISDPPAPSEADVGAATDQSGMPPGYTANNDGSVTSPNGNPVAPYPTNPFAPGYMDSFKFLGPYLGGMIKGTGQ